MNGRLQKKSPPPNTPAQTRKFPGSQILILESHPVDDPRQPGAGTGTRDRQPASLDALRLPFMKPQLDQMMRDRERRWQVQLTLRRPFLLWISRRLLADGASQGRKPESEEGPECSWRAWRQPPSRRTSALRRARGSRRSPSAAGSRLRASSRRSRSSATRGRATAATACRPPYRSPTEVQPPRTPRAIQLQLQHSVIDARRREGWREQMQHRTGFNGLSRLHEAR